MSFDVVMWMVGFRFVMSFDGGWSLFMKLVIVAFLLVCACCACPFALALIALTLERACEKKGTTHPSKHRWEEVKPSRWTVNVILIPPPRGLQKETETAIKFVTAVFFFWKNRPVIIFWRMVHHRRGCCPEGFLSQGRTQPKSHLSDCAARAELFLSSEVRHSRDLNNCTLHIKFFRLQNPRWERPTLQTPAPVFAMFRRCTGSSVGMGLVASS